MAFSELDGARGLRFVWRDFQQSSGPAPNSVAAGLGRSSLAKRLSARIYRERLDAKTFAGDDRGATRTTRSKTWLWVGNTFSTAGADDARNLPGRERSDAE